MEKRFHVASVFMADCPKSKRMDLFEYAQQASPVAGRGLALRPYQQEAVNALLTSLKSGEHPLLILPTGCGKTIVFAELIYRWASEIGESSLVLAHREELIDQAMTKIKMVAGISCGVEKAEQRSQGEKCVLGSVQSMNQKRLSGFQREHFGLIITDEAHHSTAKTYKNVYDYFAMSKRVGVTATPDRKDQNNIGAIYTKIAYNYSLVTAIKEGYLSRLVGVQCEAEIDLSQCKKSAGDFQDEDLGEAVMKSASAIADGIVREAEGKKTIVFTPNVASSELIAQILTEKGMSARAVSGSTPKNERVRALWEFERGSVQALVNCNLFTEGFDAPWIECVAIARPTLSRSLYSQMVGRGLRLWDGKDFCKLIEFTINSQEHKLVTAFELFNDPKFSNRIKEEAAKKKGYQTDFLAILENAEEEARRIRERIITTESGFQKFDPLGFCDLEGLDVDGEIDWSSSDGVKPWMTKGISDRQKEVLTKAGFSVQRLSELTKWQASRIIGHVMQKGGGHWPGFFKFMRDKKREMEVVAK